jgi:hypothetical protein
MDPGDAPARERRHEGQEKQGMAESPVINELLDRTVDWDEDIQVGERS